MGVARTVKGFPANLAERPDHRALVAGDRSLTYRELDERASRLAHALTELGVEEGDRLAVMLPNGIPFVEAMAAVREGRRGHGDPQLAPASGRGRVDPRRLRRRAPS